MHLVNIGSKSRAKTNAKDAKKNAKSADVSARLSGGPPGKAKADGE
jgi:hypothetical protein